VHRPRLLEGESEDGDCGHHESDPCEACNGSPVLSPAGEDQGDDGLEDEVGGEHPGGQSHGLGDIGEQEEGVMGIVSMCWTRG